MSNLGGETDISLTLSMCEVRLIVRESSVRVRFCLKKGSHLYLQTKMYCNDNSYYNEACTKQVCTLSLALT